MTLERDRWSLVVVAGALAFIAMLDMSIVNVALAPIGEKLVAPPEIVQWAVLGYQLPVVALLLPAGRWLETSGLRAALLAAIAGFTLSSAAAAASPWIGWLIAARLLQGTCGAVLFVLMPLLAAQAVRPQLRGRAMSIPATLGPLGAVTGPALGGLLLDHFGWRAVFLVKIPFCLVTLAVAYRATPRGGRLLVPDRRTVADVCLAGGTVTAMLLALTLAPATPTWSALFAVAAPLLVLWLRTAAGRTATGVLRDSGTFGVHGAVLALGAAFAGMHYLVALHLQRDGGVSATTTGLVMLAFPLAMGLAGPVGGRLADRFGPRPTATAGTALTALGLLLLVPLGTDWSPPDVAWRLALAGVGMGLYGGPAQALVMSAVPPDRMATAGSTVQLARSLGFTLGPAMATAAWALAGSGMDGVRTGLGVAAVTACAAIFLIVAGRAGKPPLTGSRATRSPLTRSATDGR